jgi:hypothetical protein
MNDKPQTSSQVNAYWIYTYELPNSTPVYYGGDYLGRVQEDDIVYAMIVVAETRGKAKSIFVRHINAIWGSGTIEYMDIKSAFVLVKDAPYPVGVADDCPEVPHQHPLWKLVAERFWSNYDPVQVEIDMGVHPVTNQSLLSGGAA